MNDLQNYFKVIKNNWYLRIDLNSEKKPLKSLHILNITNGSSEKSNGSYW